MIMNIKAAGLTGGFILLYKSVDPDLPARFGNDMPVPFRKRIISALTQTINVRTISDQSKIVMIISGSSVT